ncbi:MAG: outer membrane protein precursor [Myxococcaceae bacterium]|nr:outer membrane protein precursor [Myxococcaceae bacterium]
MQIDPPHADVRSLLGVARLTCALLLGVMATCSARVSAQGSLYNVRESAGVGLVTSTDQINVLHYDRFGVLAGAQVGRTMLPWLELHAGAQVGGFWASQGRTGALVDATLGALLRVERKGLSPYVSLDVGAGLTDVLVRPYVSLTAGLDAPLRGRHRIGPVVGYGQLVQWNGAFETTDARFFWFGLSLRQQLGRATAPPAKPPPRFSRREVARPEPPAEPASASPPSEDVLTLIERALPSTSTERVELLAPILFAFDSDELLPAGVAMLHEVRQTLASRPEIALVQIEGYADQRGNVAYNQALSQRRAERVQAWLVEHGIAPERLSTVPRGATDFVEPGRDEPAHEQNRRVIFRVLEQEQESTP